MRYNLSETEIKKLLKNIVVLIDTAEKENYHIEKYFLDSKIDFVRKKLKEADYSAYIEYNSDTKKILESMGVHRDLYFTDEVLIERKAHLDELAGNLHTRKETVDYSTGEVIRKGNRERERFKFELARIRLSGAKCHLFVEDNAGDINLRKANYRSDYLPKSFMGSIESFCSEFDIELEFISQLVTGSKIYWKLYYGIRDVLVKGNIDKINNARAIEDIEEDEGVEDNWASHCTSVFEGVSNGA
ncbi:MAG: hypothetical protein ACRDD7_16370 [Peptostreptococcaceae bacterium]